MKKGEELLKISEVEKETGISKQKIQRWDNEGMLPFTVRIGTARNYYRKDLKKIIEIDELMEQYKNTDLVKEKLRQMQEQKGEEPALAVETDEERQIRIFQKALGRDEMLEFFEGLGQEMKMYRDYVDEQREQIQKRDDLLRIQGEEIIKLREEMEEMKSMLSQPVINEDELLRRIDEDIIKKRDQELMNNLRKSMEEQVEETPKKKGFFGRLFG